MIATKPFDPTRRAGITLALSLTLAACASPSRQARRSSRSLQIDAAKRTEVVMTALSLLETNYQYGSARPVRGFDCSGLVKYVFDTAAQARLPHNTEQIAELSRPIPRSSLQPGDFVFFNTLGQSNSHMGIYLGDASFINAPSTGGRVRIDSLNSPYYTRHFESARTVFRP